MKRIGDLTTLRDLSKRRSTSAASTPTFSEDANECPICRGAGFLRMDAPVGSPNFGRLIPCECKTSERIERDRARLIEVSGLEHFDRWTFENFDPDVPGVRQAFETSLAYAHDPTGWLLLIGSYGCGKTHLAAAIANYVMTYQMAYPLFAVVPDLLDHLRSAFAPDQQVSYDERFNNIRTTNLLVLDDLGTENSTPWATEKLFQIINYRYNQQLPTIITTNKDLDRLDPRIASRIKDGTVCEHVFINARDYRERQWQRRSMR